ncbi:hypothetical protein AB3N59_10805 [Leptospira sp. WS92.C1]
MSRSRKHWIAFLGIAAFFMALFCFTIMLSGKNCPAFPSVQQASSGDLPPCHQKQDKTNPVSSCSNCQLVVSPESLHPKTPEINLSYLSVLFWFLDHENFDLGTFSRRIYPFLAVSKSNPQQSVLDSISSVRLLT